MNDETSETDPDELVGLISVLLVADVFGREPEQVVADVLRERRRELP